VLLSSGVVRRLVAVAARSPGPRSVPAGYSYSGTEWRAARSRRSVSVACMAGESAVFPPAWRRLQGAFGMRITRPATHRSGRASPRIRTVRVARIHLVVRYRNAIGRYAMKMTISDHSTRRAVAKRVGGGAVGQHVWRARPTLTMRVLPRPPWVPREEGVPKIRAVAPSAV
jgi:hypothetical protein